jgi:hypothetical protein
MDLETIQQENEPEKEEEEDFFRRKGNKRTAETGPPPPVRRRLFSKSEVTEESFPRTFPRPEGTGEFVRQIPARSCLALDLLDEGTAAFCVESCGVLKLFSLLANVFSLMRIVEDHRNQIRYVDPVSKPYLLFMLSESEGRPGKRHCFGTAFFGLISPNAEGAFDYSGVFAKGKEGREIFENSPKAFFSDDRDKQRLNFSSADGAPLGTSARRSPMGRF